MEENIVEIATLAGGCFWCTEAIFKKLKGVIKVTPGYSGGHKDNPSYSQVTSGTTGHAESIQIEFDPNTISYKMILEIFWHLHDPTTLNQQGADVGTQYRSAIFYHTPLQKQIATQLKDELNKSGDFKNSIVTEITEFTNFYKAEEYHLDFYNQNRDSMYCQVVIDPKIQKLLREYKQQVIQ